MSALRLRCVGLIALLALMLTTGDLPAQFVNVTASSGINLPPSLPTTEFGRGAAWADFDGDGDLDLMAPQGTLLPVLVFWNDGSGNFSSQIVGQLTALPSSPHACVAADFDNDGDQDAYICLGDGQTGPANILLVNQGAGVFVDQAALRGVGTLGCSYSASWGDFNRDGWLDLYVGNLYQLGGGLPGHTLYQNDGTGHFSDVTLQSGTASPGNAFVAFWHDVDQDMWPDLVIANDKGSGTGAPSALLRNKRDGTFTDIGPTIRANAPIDGMGATLADFDQDGDWDMFQTNNPNGHVLFVWDQTIARFNIPNGNWFFEANLRGVQSAATGWGAGFADYDCDGDDDLLVMMAPSQSHLFRNDPGFSFTDVTLAQAIPTCAPGGYSFAWVDYDDDGDLDLWDSGLITSGQLGQNQASGNNWLKIRLIGTSSNRDALGAMVLARSASRSQRRLVTSGEGYLSDGDKRVHFGLGMDTSVDQLEIRWPSGTIQILESVAANQTLTVTEPRFTGPSAGLTLGTTHPILFDVPDDVGTFYYCGFTLDPFAHTTLADGRIVRLAPLDPAFVYSTTLGNPMLFPFVGVLPSGGVTLQLVLPAGVLPPALTIPIYFLGFTIDAGFPGSIKSIVGPHPFLIS